MTTRARPLKPMPGFYAAGRVSEAEGGYRVDTGPNSASRLFVDTPTAQKLFPGLDIEGTPVNGFAALRIQVGDIERARAALANNRVAFVPRQAGRSRTSRGKRHGHRIYGRLGRRAAARSPVSNGAKAIAATMPNRGPAFQACGPIPPQ